MAGAFKWSTACLDWRERIVARESLVPCPPLFAEKAEDALGAFKSLQVVDLPKGANDRHPTLGEVCDEFVFDLVAAIFGAEDPETGKRLIKEFMLLISKKNGKSMIAAGIMVTALIVNWRPNAILQILAPTLEVANNSFEPAMGMVRADPELSIVLKVVEHQRQIKHLGTGAVLKVIAADSDTVAGGKASITLIEELWLFGKKPKAAAMLREALGGGSARPEAFTLYITTHSDEPPSGVFKTKLSYFRDVRDGVIDDPSAMAMLYEWPEKMLDDEAYLDPAFFYITNPHIERSVTVEWLQGELRREQVGEGEGLQIFLAKHLNVEIGLRLRRDRWRGADYWELRADTTLTLAALLERCEVAVVGVDGGGLDDLYGLCVAGRERSTGRWLYWFKAWCWPDVLSRRKEIATILTDYAKDGDLVICSDEMLETLGLGEDDEDYEQPQDIREIVAVIKTVKESGLLPKENAVGLDPQGVGDLVDALAKIGLEAPQVVAIGQGFRLMSAIVGLARKLKFGGALHCGSRMMAWCVSNAKEELGRQTVMIVKNVQGTGKIDPFMAGLNATKLLEMNPVAANDNRSPYHDRGFLIV
ncbi:terminase large subunit domain-containing protein [Novosphingobium clariflavum]|uniref:Terminase large subunit domain-containing protein n=1 Tax=Novosphingobium clariflavum TaxID=2029884 RepID=A0ABV6S5X2_9SPHN|nr:terminase large subunit [Novosphingobium clariflavum]